MHCTARVLQQVCALHALSLSLYLYVHVYTCVLCIYVCFVVVLSNCVFLLSASVWFLLSSWLHSRDRYGVVRHTRKIVKDMYLVPVSQGKEVPDELLQVLGQMPGTCAEEDLLLAVIITSTTSSSEGSTRKQRLSSTRSSLGGGAADTGYVPGQLLVGDVDARHTHGHTHGHGHKHGHAPMPVQEADIDPGRFTPPFPPPDLAAASYASTQMAESFFQSLGRTFR